ncbi:MAG: electron transport complex subunit RsxC [Odoribacter sp.]|nr:electron transport complex subunit RsxC [Odoribacter sp.]
MLKTFRIGGVHPPENKLSAGEQIRVLPLPEEVIIPLGQHIGTPASPIVQKGDTVKAGQLIAQAAGFVSANIHSSVSGTVTAIDNFTDAAGFSRPAITIRVEGDEWMPEIIREATPGFDSSLSKEEIIKAIADAGIVGMGGATFPTQVKLTPPPGNKAELLIINGVECEPYLTADHRVMLEKSGELIAGVQFLMKAIGVDKAVIGIENNKQDAIARLRQIAAGAPGVEICPLKMKYPQGGEKQLIEAITKRAVPSGALPIAVGAVVQNAGTALAVYEAVMLKKPLFERVVTVTGKSLAQPGNYLCRIGTPVSKLIEAAGGIPEDTAKIIGGGPMMGRTMVNIGSPIMKGTSGILLLNNREARRRPARNCIRCSKCVSACPMGLEPYLLAKLSSFNLLERMEAEKVMDCIECGSCSFTCPSNRPLLDYIRLGKGRTGAMIRNRKK